MTFPYFEKIDYTEEYINNHKILIATIVDKDSWTDNKFDYLKKKIRFHYSVVQDDKCAYCRRQLNFGGHSEPIEHIVPRKDKFEWMFTQQNLVLSCNACNSHKSGKPTLSMSKLVSAVYSTDMKDYLIYHPHFDTYSDELELIDEIYYRWKTPKGKRTIEVCGLNNLSHLLFNSANKNRNNKYSEVLDKITNPTKFGLTKKDVAEFRKVLIKRIKHMKKLKSV